MLMSADTDALSLAPLLAASLPCVPTFSRELCHNRQTEGGLALVRPDRMTAWSSVGNLDAAAQGRLRDVLAVTCCDRAVTVL